MTQDVEKLINNTLSNLKEVVDIKSIIGSPIKINESIIIIPICKMNMGLISGGGDVDKDRLRKAKIENWCGVNATGVNYTPVGVLAIIDKVVKYIPLSNGVPYYDISQGLDKIINKIIDSMEKKDNAKNKK